MATTVIDELVTIIRYNTSNRELRRAEQQVNDFTRNTQRQFQSWGQNISKITRAATVVLGALGAGAFGVGAAEERSLLNLRTQLGLAADEVEDLKAPLRDISKETNRPLKELNDAIFSVRSAGLGGADAMEVLNASAKAAASGLGDTKSIALLAGGAVNTFGSDVLGGERAVEILLGTVKEGNLNAAELANTMGKGFTFVDQLGADLAEYGASIAGYTRTAQSASAATDAVSATFRALATPSSEGAKILKDVGFSVADVRRAVKEDGFLATLDRLRTALGGNEVKLRQLLGEANAVGFALHATGEGAAEYEQILGGVRDTVGDVSKGFEIYANSSVADADRATNNLRLALSTLYNNVLAPLLQLFGKLPAAIQTVVLGMGAMQIASTVGLGPSVGGLVTSLGRFIVALKTGAIWNSNFILSLRLAAISAGKYVASLKIAAVATKVFRGVMLITGGAARAMWLAITGPIGLAIAAFALVGFVVYKFRRQILGALKAVWSWIKGNWPLLVGILFGPFGIAAGLIFKFRDDIVGAIMWIKDKIMAIFTSLRDFVIGIWQGLGEGLAGAFRGVINAVINGLNKALEVAAGLIEGIKGALDKIPGPNPAGDFLLGVASKLRAGIPNFGIGGIVPGPLGRPLLATLHGGEMVLPPSAWQVVMDLFEGFKRGPAALPQAPHYYGQMYRSSVDNRSVTVNITEPIVIQTQATDAKGIAQELHEAIEDQIRNVAYDHDGPVER